MHVLKSLSWISYKYASNKSSHFSTLGTCHVGTDVTFSINTILYYQICQLQRTRNISSTHFCKEFKLSTSYKKEFLHLRSQTQYIPPTAISIFGWKELPSLGRALPVVSFRVPSDIYTQETTWYIDYRRFCPHLLVFRVRYVASRIGLNGR
jgi:hypothetical protein